MEAPTRHQNEGRSAFVVILLVLSASVFGYALLIASLSIPWLQRFALYAHYIRTPIWWHNLYKPEAFGFAKNQITPFKLESYDGVTLFAWHVLPLGLYEQHEATLREQQPGVVSDITKTIGFKLLTSDPKSRLIINFHGNAGHVAQGWRTDTYRVLTSHPSNLHTHLLTLDYRGFGVSSGSPSEHGLISDGVALVNWTMHTAKIPPERIVILGHSLGTAVAAGVVHHFVTDPKGPVSLSLNGTERRQELEGDADENADSDEEGGGRKERVVFAGVVLVAAFKYFPALMLDYRIAGLIPILASIRPFRFMHSLIDKLFIDKWNTAKRLQRYQRAVKGTTSSLTLIHAVNDENIPCTHSVDLFCGIVSAASGQERDEEMEVAEKRSEKIAEVKRKKGPGIFEWSEKDGRGVRLEIVEYGGHNRILTYSYVSLATFRGIRRVDTRPSESLI